MTRINLADLFPGHVPGSPYGLTRRQFALFLERLWDAPHILPANSQRGRGAAPFWTVWDDTSWHSIRRSMLWATIAAAEATRSFDRDMGSLPSMLQMSGNILQWEYVTTSGTCLLALDCRLDDENGINVPPRSRFFVVGVGSEIRHIPGDGLYHVTIPAARDCAGRTAWRQVRLAASEYPYGFDVPTN